MVLYFSEIESLRYIGHRMLDDEYIKILISHTFNKYMSAFELRTVYTQIRRLRLPNGNFKTLWKNKIRQMPRVRWK